MGGHIVHAMYGQRTGAIIGQVARLLGGTAGVRASRTVNLGHSAVLHPRGG